MVEPASEVTVDRLLRRVRQALVKVEHSYRARGRSVAELDLDELAQRMAAVVPMPSPVNDRIGPFYRADQVAQMLGITRQAIHERTKKGTLVAMRTADGVRVYPTFQFEGHRIVAGLPEVLAELRGAEPWAIAAWLVSPTAGLGGATPLEVVRKSEDLQALRDLARDARSRWTR